MRITHTVPKGVRRVRADKELARAFPEHSRVALQRAFDDSGIWVNGGLVKRNQPVAPGDLIEFELPELKPVEIKAVAIPLNVVYEDEHFLALNKAVGMVVHPGAATREDTLVHALLAHCAGRLSGIGGVERSGIVHRLDRGTSGIMVAAKTDTAHRALAEQFVSRALVKEYLALVRGRPALLSGVVEAPIGRDQRHRHKMAVVEEGNKGRSARTDWELLERFPYGDSLLRCRIHTGRTHQIRVHMKHLGHALLGDTVYGWKPDPRLDLQPGRVMLHAARLQLNHPISGDPMDLHAPLPTDFEDQLTVLRRSDASDPASERP